MMKLLPLLLSLLTLGVLTVDYLESVNSQAQKADNVADIKVYQPKLIPEELLVVEKNWREKKNKRTEKNAPKKTEKVKPSSQQVLTLGEQNYILYGIFNDPKQPFILLKDESGNMLRLAKGEQLGQGATLVSLTSDKVGFESNNEIIEFKLFERK